jgi:gluconokinase
LNCIIGIDIGTSSTKVTAFARDGGVMASANQSYPLIQTEAGFAEQDPDVLLNAVRDCLNTVIASIGHRARITGISFSAAMHGIMALDSNSIPLTRLLTWADSRSNAESDEIRASDEAMSIYSATGVPIHPMSPLCKIRWLNRHRPEIMSKAFMLAGIKEYVLFKLTGQWVMDHSIASATGLFDIRALDWFEPALRWAGVRREQLPRPVPVSWSTSLIVADSASNARQAGWNLHMAENELSSQSPRLIIGGSDGCLANLGSGAMETGLLALTIGTSGAVRMTVQKPAPDPMGRTFNYILWPGAFVTGGPVNNGGIIIKWFSEAILGRHFRGAEDFKWFLDEAGAVLPGAEGLTCLPWFLGERAPIWDARATGIFHGMTLRHTRAHMMRAIVEGICFSLYSIAEILTQTAGPVERVLASGGFTASPAWVQMIADIFGTPVDLAQDADASATGAAMLGFIATGEAQGPEDFLSWTGSHQRFMPDTKRQDLYREAYKKFTQLSGSYLASRQP